MTPSEIRNLFETALPEGAYAEATLEPGHIYMPSGHYKAIALDRPLVVGDRGAGKSFWLRSLVDQKRRELIGHVFGFPSLLSCEVTTGFDPYNSTENYPDAQQLATLIQSGIEPSDIWYTVIVQAFLPTIIPHEVNEWSDKVKWVNKQSGAVAKQLRDKNSALAAEGKSLLIAFDGLDLVAKKWKSTIILVRGLLQTQLDFSKYTHLRTKAFIRPDLFADPEVRRFPDASKLVSLAVKLEWNSIDLYGLMWQYLANSSTAASKSFRIFCNQIGLFNWSPSEGGLFFLSEETKHNESIQEALFHKLAGATMGGARSGNTWTWLPNHLSDAHGYTSPRSFLVALRSAAVDSRTRTFVGTEYALHTASIKEGVSSASKVRLDELAENFPWSNDIFEPLKRLALPAKRQDVVSLWEKAHTLATLLSAHNQDTPQNQVPLPEKISASDPGSILLALEQLGLCRMLDDGRVDFPDIVRVNAGMTRKGGVPVRR